MMQSDIEQTASSECTQENMQTVSRSHHGEAGVHHKHQRAHDCQEEGVHSLLNACQAVCQRRFADDGELVTEGLGSCRGLEQTRTASNEAGRKAGVNHMGSGGAG